jgi:DNA-binding transcriptional MerR regulator
LKGLLAKKHKEVQLSKSNSKRKQKSDGDLPAIPDKRYFAISEVSYLCGVKAYVLRYWEQEFPQLKPVKRRGNRRYYQLQDILLVRQIRKLLYEDGFTIEGARSQLSIADEPVSQTVKTDAMMKKVIAELEVVLQSLRADVATSH